MVGIVKMKPTDYLETLLQSEPSGSLRRKLNRQQRAGTWATSVVTSWAGTRRPAAPPASGPHLKDLRNTWLVTRQFDTRHPGQIPCNIKHNNPPE